MLKFRMAKTERETSFHRYVVRFEEPSRGRLWDSYSPTRRLQERLRWNEDRIEGMESWLREKGLWDDVQSVARPSAFDVAFLIATSTVAEQLAELPGVVSVIEDLPFEANDELPE